MYERACAQLCPFGVYPGLCARCLHLDCLVLFFWLYFTLQSLVVPDLFLYLVAVYNFVCYLVRLQGFLSLLYPIWNDSFECIWNYMRAFATQSRLN
jgi:hypothetical protein